MITARSRVAQIVPPPIAHMAALAAARRRQGHRVLMLGQAVPWYGPPRWALERLATTLHDPVMHRYSPDPGEEEVREKVCGKWFGDRGFEVDPVREIHLTCGASSAFLSALTVACDPGERVVFTDPYYFDHLFAAQLSGLDPSLVPMRDDGDSLRLDVEAMVREIKRGCAAVVLVNPSNPAGTVVSDGDMRRMAEECAATRTALIVDETYERLVFDSRARWHPWHDAETRAVTLVVGSFSKSLGMAGWRLGYLLGHPALMEEALKVQDAVVICAPVVAQRLLGLILEGPYETWIDEHMRELARRRTMVWESLRPSSFILWRPTEGGLFSFLGYPGQLASADAAALILAETGVALVPGLAFGARGEGHLRLSFGSSTFEELREALSLLAGFDPSRDRGSGSE